MSKLSYSVAEAAAATGFSVSHLDRAIRSGQLRIKWSDEDDDGNGAGKRVILASALAAYLDGLVDG